MKISIITINYNNISGLEITLNSVFSQSCCDFEYIVIDGGSTDGSVEVLKNQAQHISFWVSERDAGIYNAMNKGIAKATGAYLIFLNSGDCFCSNDILQKCYDYMESNPGADVYYGDIFVVNDKSNTTKWLKTHPDYLSLDFLKYNTINHQASIIKSKLFDQFGFYPENYKVASDYWLFLSCLVNNKKFSYLGFPMVNYDLTGFSYHNYDLYVIEKESIWSLTVPRWVLEITKECEGYKDELRGMTGYKIIDTAIILNSKFQQVKKYFKN